MNGDIISDETINTILGLADYAPTHGVTEPWRFIVYNKHKAAAFCEAHALLYKTHTAAEKFDASKYDKLLHMGDKASHIVIAAMQRGDLPKIPAWEEQAATSAAIQNVLLGATAMGIASYWGSGGMTQHASLKEYLALRDEDFVMGILYFGYAGKQPAFNRNIPFEKKVKWM